MAKQAYDSKTCGQCRSIIPLDAKRCANCGARQGAPVMQAALAVAVGLGVVVFVMWWIGNGMKF